MQDGSRLLIYGAYGYTGELCARFAAERGWRPTLAGRRAEALAPVASRLGLPQRVFGLDRAAEVRAGLEGMSAVLHCAGPFEVTSRPMADAALAAGVHYLDVTGEVQVFEALAARGDEAKERGVLLLPGVGMDVVPSDCLARHVADRLPGARRLSIGVRSIGGVSHGTATTIVRNAHRPGLVRRAGKLEAVPPGSRKRRIDFGSGPVEALRVPWGDVSTAWYTTGIGDIEVYMVLPRAAAHVLRANRLLRGALTSKPLRRLLQRRIDAGPPGPSDSQRAGGHSHFWALAEDDRGGRAEARLHGPEGYTFTAHAALEIARRVLAGELEPGFWTPGGLYGADLALAVEGVRREDVC